MFKKPRLVLCFVLATLASVSEIVVGRLHRKDILETDLTPLNTIYRDRNEVDSSNPLLFAEAIKFPQILPYVVLRYKDSVFTYSRKKGEEARLHGTRSIGIGGHIDVEDHHSNLEHLITIARTRECVEEVGIDVSVREYSAAILGLPAILDYTNPVGSVHMGLPCVVYLTDKGFQDLKPNLDELHDPQWVDINDLKQHVDLYESWSKELITKDLT